MLQHLHVWESAAQLRCTERHAWSHVQQGKQEPCLGARVGQAIAHGQACQTEQGRSHVHCALRQRPAFCQRSHPPLPLAMRRLHLQYKVPCAHCNMRRLASDQCHMHVHDESAPMLGTYLPA